LSILYENRIKSEIKNRKSKIVIFCRFQSGEVFGWGIVEDHEVWEVTPDIFSPFTKTGRSFGMNDVRFLAPCQPSKIVAVGLNYKDHITEFGRTEIPTEPVLFLKAPSSLVGPDEKIIVPKGVGQVDYEAELAVVISKKCRHISENEAMDYVLGVTCLNDVTARELQKKDSQWARAKSFDTFAPVGPWIADGLPVNNLRVEAYVNKKAVQIGHTSQMIFSVPKLISFVSGVMTLYPGDIISTGTPKGVGAVKAGDVIEILVEGVGVLRNPVSEES
jgi:2-keto-4-pentenoate hydratase/2-oxohepta-3-ene-1,7-dioic acid hydratase in catechol pathway